MTTNQTVKTDGRQSARIKCRVIVDQVGPTIDISAGGLRILTANPATAGAELRVAFLMPESEQQVQCHGRVVHVAPSTIDQELYEIGVQFQRMMSRHREALQEYVSLRAGESGLD